MNEKTKIIEDIEVLPSSEKTQLIDVAKSYEEQANKISIFSDSDYAIAAEQTKQVKILQKKMEDYWEPIRLATKSAYDNVLARKKEMLETPKKIERILKSKMAEYLQIKEQERKAREDAEREKLQNEVNEKFEDAVKAASCGDNEGAEYALMEAEVLEASATTYEIGKSTPKVDGVSASKAWKIISIDPSKVPVAINGYELRPVDDKAIMRCIKENKGNISIPGVVFEQTSSISIRI